jgi:hypothetical protein
MPKQILACKDLNIATNVIILETKQIDFLCQCRNFEIPFCFHWQQGHLRQGQKRSHFTLKRIQSSVKLEKVIQRNS